MVGGNGGRGVVGTFNSVGTFLWKKKLYHNDTLYQILPKVLLSCDIPKSTLLYWSPFTRFCRIMRLSPSIHFYIGHPLPDSVGSCDCLLKCVIYPSLHFYIGHPLPDSVDSEIVWDL